MSNSFTELQSVCTDPVKRIDMICRVVLVSIYRWYANIIANTNSIKGYRLYTSVTFVQFGGLICHILSQRTAERVPSEANITTLTNSLKHRILIVITNRAILIESLKNKLSSSSKLPHPVCWKYSRTNKPISVPISKIVSATKSEYNLFGFWVL